MKRTFEELLEAATKIYDEAREQDRGHAILTITRGLMDAQHEAAEDMLSDIELRLTPPVEGKH